MGGTGRRPQIQMRFQNAFVKHFTNAKCICFAFHKCEKCICEVVVSMLRRDKTKICVLVRLNKHCHWTWPVTIWMYVGFPRCSFISFITIE